MSARRYGFENTVRAFASLLMFGACACGSGSGDDSTKSGGDESGRQTSGRGESCLGLLGKPCGTGLYCDVEDFSCGAADQTGICKEIPEVCTAVFAPVCGCDDKTYGNACEAAGAGVSLSAPAACAG